MRLPSAHAPVLPTWRPRIFFSDDLPVSYLPSQIDGEAASSSLNFRSSPWKLLYADIKLVLTLCPWILVLCVPMRTTNPISELYPSWANVWQLVLHFCLSVLGLVWLLVVVPVALGAPGIGFLAFMGLYCAITAVVCIPLNWGSRVIESAVDGVQKRPGERWLFVNGIITGKHWLQANVDMISLIFRRPVEGIHNRTYGMVFDLIECLVQRCFSYSTKDTRVLYDHLKSILLDPATEKCVVIAHSQGGIILSTVLDSLFADIPSGAFKKMEIYTFGCAANHFNNPVRFVPSSIEHNVPSTDPQAPEERLIQHIEHYCNEFDFVARFGVLHFTGNKLENRFVGKVFKNKGQPGHLLNQHYLDVMFARDNPQFLDTVVEVEQDKAVKREEAAGAEQKHQLRSARVFPPALTEFRMASAKVPGDLDRARTLGRSLTAPAQLGVYNFAQQAMASAENQRGRTVRELSRLWRYKGGRSPGSHPAQGGGRRAST